MFQKEMGKMREQELQWFSKDVNQYFIHEAKSRKEQESSLSDFIEQRCVILRQQIAEESK